MSQRHLTEAAMRLSPDLLGEALASPRRRLAAFIIDWLVLFLPSLTLAAAGALLFLWWTDQTAFRALVELVRDEGLTNSGRHRLWQEIAPLLVRTRMPGVPSEVIAAVDRGEVEVAAQLLEDYDLMFALRIGGESDAETAPGQIRVEIDRFIPRWARAAVSYGVAALYFTLCTALCSGATVGKRWLRIRVVRLDGGEIGIVAAFERFLGYWQIPASLGLSLLDLWRDLNRRLPHDRLVHTAVLGPTPHSRGRRLRRLWRLRVRSVGKNAAPESSVSGG